MLHSVEFSELGRFLDSSVNADGLDLVISWWRGEYAPLLIIDDLHCYRVIKSRGGLRFWSSLDRLVSSLADHGVHQFRVVSVPPEQIAHRFDDIQPDLSVAEAF